MRWASLALVAVTTCVSSHAWAGPTVCASGTTTPGIDVSKWQGAIDFAKVATTQAFVIARVSDGMSVDSWFASYWPDIKAHGMVRGAYQYFEPADDPIAQADLLLSKMGPMEPGMLPPTLDVEATGGLTPAQVEAAVQQWVDHVQAQLGVAPMVYTGNWFWDPSVNSSAQSGSPLWESYYCTNCCPKIPAPWSNWAIWQYDDKGTVAGVSGDCDMNLWNGDVASLKAFAGGGVSKPTSVNVCDSNCDSASPAGTTATCYCDSQCQTYGDCCNADGSATATSCAGSTCASCNGGSTGPVCGDGACDASETCSSCPSDCGACPPVCGDFSCDASETCSSCPNDCGGYLYCGDGVCSASEKEDCKGCAQDCGFCLTTGLASSGCGDGTCTGDENCTTCTADCGVCGDYSCACLTDASCCTGDFGYYCQDACNTCIANNGGGSCPKSNCGDGVCSGETCLSCSSDCGKCPAFCGDNNCDPGEDKANCPADCSFGCQGKCGQSTASKEADGTFCYCDSLCADPTYGDCCSDKATYCP